MFEVTGFKLENESIENANNILNNHENITETFFWKLKKLLKMLKKDEL